mmetsp:Transcript_17652/g.40445  ORF Transcript_17652/g.40445 Transcript_17652/m.40445 type:complete len:227 (-) Transcript_17652:96-776(-)
MAQGAQPGEEGADERCWTLSSVSRTMPMPPAPRTMPDRRLSKGQAASSTAAFVVAAPRARKPEPSQGRSVSPDPLSPATTTTRSARPDMSMSCAIPIAWVVPAHAAFVCVFGPLHPASCASCALPRTRTRKRNFRSNSYGPADAVDETLESSAPEDGGHSTSLTRERSRANAASSSSPSSLSGLARTSRFLRAKTSRSALWAATVLDLRNLMTSPTAASMAGKDEA